MSWDNFIENTGYWIEVASNRMARRALKCNLKSLNNMAEDESIGEWISYIPEKGLTKSLKRDLMTISAKKLAEKATHPKDKDEKTYPEDLI